MSSGWFVLDKNTSAPVGPYSEQALAGLYDEGHINKDTHAWCEGRPEWQPLADVEELKYLVDPESVGVRPKKSKRKATTDADLLEFSKQIAALESGADAGPMPDAEAGAAAAAAPEAGMLDGPSTPEELEFEDDDGTVYVWDHKLRKYMPKGDPGATEAAGQGGAGPSGAPGLEYDEELMTFQVDEEKIPTLEEVRAAEAAAAAAEEAAEAQRKDRKRAGKDASTSAKGAAKHEGAAKRGAVDAAGGGGGAPAAEAAGTGKDGGGDAAAPGDAADGEPAGKKAKAEAEASKEPPTWFDLKINTNVYVTGLPLDVTAEEVCEVFTKCGVIKVDEQGRPRIKLYRDKASGELKGDALVSYLKEPSVKLACDFLSGSAFRAGMRNTMTVEPAKFEMKGQAYQPKAASKKDKKKKLAQLEERALGWGGFDDKAPAEKVTVVIKHMFAPDEFLENMLLSDELEQDVTAECGKLGAVEKVRVFKTNPEGVVTVKFKQPEPAAKCVALMHGRFFGGRQLEATMWNGFSNYSVKVKETPEEEAARLEKFSRELEGK